MTLEVATWNVNSIRARAERALAWVEAERPDVLCLQETKVVDRDFPAEAFRERGYHAVVHGQKTYNGVAILARHEPRDVLRGFDDGVDDAAARAIAATVGDVRYACVYVPNGAEVGSDKWRYKLAWLDRLGQWLERHFDPSEPLVLCGDFNVAPDDRDVHDPDAWADSVLCHPEARAALARVLEFGLTDVFREHHDEGGLYSWWDYRQLAFPKNRGLRIDHLFVTEPLVARSSDARIDREARKGKQPSDHAPVIARFDS